LWAENRTLQDFKQVSLEFDFEFLLSNGKLNFVCFIQIANT